MWEFCISLFSCLDNGHLLIEKESGHARDCAQANLHKNCANVRELLDRDFLRIFTIWCLWTTYILLCSVKETRKNLPPLLATRFTTFLGLGNVVIWCYKFSILQVIWTLIFFGFYVILVFIVYFFVILIIHVETF